MAVKNQRQTTFNIIRAYEKLTEDLIESFPQDYSDEYLKECHDRLIDLKKDCERVGLR